MKKEREKNKVLREEDLLGISRGTIWITRTYEELRRKEKGGFQRKYLQNIPRPSHQQKRPPKTDASPPRGAQGLRRRATWATAEKKGQIDCIFPFCMLLRSYL